MKFLDKIKFAGLIMLVIMVIVGLVCLDIFLDYLMAGVHGAGFRAGWGM